MTIQNTTETDKVNFLCACNHTWHRRSYSRVKSAEDQRSRSQGIGSGWNTAKPAGTSRSTTRYCEGNGKNIEYRAVCWIHIAKWIHRKHRTKCWIHNFLYDNLSWNNYTRLFCCNRNIREETVLIILTSIIHHLEWAVLYPCYPIMFFRNRNWLLFSFLQFRLTVK